MKKLLLVYGCESLARDPKAVEWVRYEVQSALSPLREGDIVLSDGGPGPGSIAASIGLARRGLKVIEMRLGGERYENGQLRGNWRSDATLVIGRDVRVLIECLAKAHDAGWKTRILALQDHQPQSSTLQILLEAEIRSFEIEAKVFKAPRPSACVVWIDTETGGTKPRYHPIIEIGAVLADSSSRKFLGSFETKCKPPPHMPVELGAALVNGYDENLWRTAPTMQEGLRKFLDWLPEDGFIAAGYNHSFDRRFITQTCEAIGLKPPAWSQTHQIDPLYKARQLLKRRGLTDDTKLDTICEFFSIENSTRHRALADAERARLVYLKIMGFEPEGSLFR